MKPLDKLAAMVGKQWMYKTNNVKIISYKQDGEKVYIVTDKDWITVTVDDLPKVIELFLEVEQDEENRRQNNDAKQQIINDNVALQVVENTRSGVEELRKVLMDNIKKIQKDKNYIPQAKAINNNINTMINMVKLEFIVTKELKRK